MIFSGKGCINLRVVATIRVVVAVRAVGAIMGVKERRTGWDVGRSARRCPLRKK